MIKFVPYTTKSKIDCPHCGAKKSFNLYYEDSTGEVFPPKFGFCDKYNNCGYNVHPTASIESLPNGYKSKIEENSIAYIEQKFVEKNLVLKSLSKYEKNGFYLNLLRMYGEDVASTICYKWMLGTTKKGETIFWHLDKSYRVWNGKKIEYSIWEMKRNKNSLPSYIYKKDDGYKIPLYGLHLFDSDKPKTIIVESEKTAILMYIFIKDANILATGGANGLSLEKAKTYSELNYKGDTILIGDCDEAGRVGVQKWKQNLDTFNCEKIKIHELNPRYNNGEDYADIIINKTELPL